MASNTRGPRGRSRKPRPSAQQLDERSTSEQSPRPDPVRQDVAKPLRATSTQTSQGARPQAPWHPLPLSELLILAGAVAFAIAVLRLRHGPSSGGPLLLVGIAAVALGTIEVTWREHSSGFRSHTILLCVLPVIALHSVVVLGYASLAQPSKLLNVGMLAVDIALFAILFRVLRTRFLDARARVASRR